MMLKNNISFFYSFILGLYAVLITMIMNPLVVVNLDYSMFDLLILFVSTTVSCFILFSLTKKFVRAQLRSVFFCLSFVLPLILSGAIIWFINTDDSNHFILFISTYFVASILPTLIVLLFILFIRLKHSPNPHVTFDTPNKKITYFELVNSKRKTTLKIDSNNILYFESNDNYVVSYYLDEDKKLNKSMDRLSLKSVEAMLQDNSIQFKRVHKSYLINPIHIKKVSGRSQAYKIEMLHTDTEIPVSRTFDVSSIESN